MVYFLLWRQSVPKDLSLMPSNSSIRDLRLSANLTQSALAWEAQVTRHSIIRLEQLCYPTPLPSVVNALSDTTGLSTVRISSDYLSDVVANRLLAGQEIFSDASLIMRLLSAIEVINLSDLTSADHPFKEWRCLLFHSLGLPTSRIYFCQRTSIHPAIVGKYEDFKTGFPTAIRLALTECGLSPEAMARFDAACFNKTTRSD